MLYDSSNIEDLRQIITDQAIEIASLKRNLQIDADYIDALLARQAEYPPKAVAGAVEIGGKYDVYAEVKQDEAV